MQSHSGDASPKVEEDASHAKDVSIKKEEEESSLGGASPKAKEGNESHIGNLSPRVKEEVSEFAESNSPSNLENTAEKTSDVSSSLEEEDEVQIVEDPDDQIYSNACNQLVVYDPEANGMGQIAPVPEAAEFPPPFLPNNAPRPPRVLPSVGAFTVQCANCFKWRLIPTKEKYEEIRESILQLPFVCVKAREWRPDVSCDDPADISQDGSRLWAIDKPNIAQPPPGWERLLRIRGEGSTRFADVYYVAPSGKKLRSMVDVQKYLLEHPEYIRAGVTMSQFSFQIPKPLQENYVRKKRPARVTSLETELPVPGSLEPTQANPLSWISPDMQSGGSGESTPPYFESPILNRSPPPKKRATKSPAKQMYNSSSSPLCNQPRMKVEEPSTLPRNSSF